MSILLRSYHCQLDFDAIDLHCSLSILEGIGEMFCRITLPNFATFFNVEKIFKLWSYKRGWVSYDMSVPLQLTKLFAFFGIDQRSMRARACKRKQSLQLWGVGWVEPKISFNFSRWDEGGELSLLQIFLLDFKSWIECSHGMCLKFFQ